MYKSATFPDAQGKRDRKGKRSIRDRRLGWVSLFESVVQVTTNDQKQESHNVVKLPQCNNAITGGRDEYLLVGAEIQRIHIALVVLQSHKRRRGSDV